MLCQLNRRSLSIVGTGRLKVEKPPNGPVPALLTTLPGTLTAAAKAAASAAAIAVASATALATALPPVCPLPIYAAVASANAVPPLVFHGPYNSLQESSAAAVGDRSAHGSGWLDYSASAPWRTGSLFAASAPVLARADHATPAAAPTAAAAAAAPTAAAAAAASTAGAPPDADDEEGAENLAGDLAVGQRFMSRRNADGTITSCFLVAREAADAFAQEKGFRFVQLPGSQPSEGRYVIGCHCAGQPPPAEFKGAEPSSRSASPIVLAIHAIDPAMTAALTGSTPTAIRQPPASKKCGCLVAIVFNIDRDSGVGELAVCVVNSLRHNLNQHTVHPMIPPNMVAVFSAEMTKDIERLTVGASKLRDIRRFLRKVRISFAFILRTSVIMYWPQNYPGVMWHDLSLRNAVRCARSKAGGTIASRKFNQAGMLLIELQKAQDEGLLRFRVATETYYAEDGSPFQRMQRVFFSPTFSLKLLETHGEVLFQDSTFGLTVYVEWIVLKYDTRVYLGYLLFIYFVLHFLSFRFAGLKLFLIIGIRSDGTGFLVGAGFIPEESVVDITWCWEMVRKAIAYACSICLLLCV